MLLANFYFFYFSRKKHCAPAASKHSGVSGTNVIFVVITVEITHYDIFDTYQFMQ